MKKKNSHFDKKLFFKQAEFSTRALHVGQRGKADKIFSMMLIFNKKFCVTASQWGSKAVVLPIVTATTYEQSAPTVHSVQKTIPKLIKILRFNKKILQFEIGFLLRSIN